jgi:hypothetical protein
MRLKFKPLSAHSAKPTIPAAPSVTENIRVKIEPRSDVGKGIYEVHVQLADHPEGSSFVLTSPRDFAFRKTA